MVHFQRNFTRLLKNIVQVSETAKVRSKIVEIVRVLILPQQLVVSIVAIKNLLTSQIPHCKQRLPACHFFETLGSTVQTVTTCLLFLLLGVTSGTTTPTTNDPVGNHLYSVRKICTTRCQVISSQSLHGPP